MSFGSRAFGVGAFGTGALPSSSPSGPVTGTSAITFTMGATTTGTVRVRGASAVTFAITSSATATVAVSGASVLTFTMPAISMGTVASLGRAGLRAVRPFPSPVNATVGIDANIVRANDNITAAAFTAHDADVRMHLQSSLLADRPAPGVIGRPWITIDGTPTLWLDTGSAWVVL